ncbi:hypothetical protein CVT25_013450 [Psilocybe cyanescens]|uniref:Uncharacterized protein n=1 Tax=Psilocybe cyanescens TaxID=93625 RepID=A0A409WTK6_PSICY|nr:hypothetical protein CVT25_013450 [Psilocybe cyanescens]
MFFSQFFLPLLAFGSLSVLSAPVPSDIERRADISNVLGIVGTLQGQAGIILPEINSLLSSGFATQSNLTPLVGSLVTSLNSATSSVSALGVVNPASGGTPANVANAVAPIVQQITSTLNNAQTAVPGLSTVLVTLGFDASLNQFLTGLEIAVAGSLSASATPVPETVEKRADISDVLSVISTLKSSTGTIIPQINSLVSDGTASESNVTPLISDLITSLNTASSSLASIGSVDSTSGGSATDVANAIAPIITDITTTLSSVNTAVPGLANLLGGLGLDAALNQVLTGLETLLAGVLNLVAQLTSGLPSSFRLVDVAGLLRSLAFGLTLGSLGL